MKYEEAKSLVKRLAGMFPGRVTQEQGKAWPKSLLPFGYQAARRAVDAQAQRESPDFPALIESLSAAVRAAAVGTNAPRPTETWCDMQRRTCPWVNQAAGRRSSDLEVVLRIHRQLWFGPAGKREACRAKIEHDCRMELRDVGVTGEVATAYVATVFNDDPDYFRTVLQELRGQLTSPQHQYAIA